MSNIWSMVVTKPKETVDQYFDEILKVRRTIFDSEPDDILSIALVKIYHTAILTLHIRTSRTTSITGCGGLGRLAAVPWQTWLVHVPRVYMDWERCHHSFSLCLKFLVLAIAETFTHR